MNDILKSLINLLKSSRRIHFNFVNEQLAEGEWRSEYWSGNASSILLKMNDRFFILTAKHVLAHTAYPYPNASPIWVDAQNKFHERKHVTQYLHCGRQWHIEDLIPNDGFFDNDEEKDILLIEMFPPRELFYPDDYLDFDRNIVYLSEEDFVDGKPCFISGFPARLNGYSYDNPPQGYTHSTEIHREHLSGKFIKEGDFGFIELSDSRSHLDLVGFSGGLVISTIGDTPDLGFAGLVIRGGNGKIHFIPVYAFIDALLNYQQSNSELIDPNFGKTPQDLGLTFEEVMSIELRMAFDALGLNVSEQKISSILNPKG
ncbi:MAG: hypothetical protein LPK25_13355 [Cyclobacteriaceae bacterium]|nr:hypothetical protein [Cyclobacteriaceae bacterium]